MTFAETLRQARYDLHLTQGQLALALRRSTQTVSNWETGRSVPWAHVERLVIEHLRLMQGLVGKAAPVETPLDRDVVEAFRFAAADEKTARTNIVPRRVVLGEG